MRWPNCVAQTVLFEQQCRCDAQFIQHVRLRDYLSDYGKGKLQKSLAEWMSDSQEFFPGIPSLSAGGTSVKWPLLDTQWANDIPSAQARPSTPTHEKPDTDEQKWGPDAGELLQYARASDTVACS